MNAKANQGLLLQTCGLYFWAIPLLPPASQIHENVPPLSLPVKTIVLPLSGVDTEGVALNVTEIVHGAAPLLVVTVLTYLPR